MGSSWERIIGIARRILNSMFLQLGPSKLTHKVLTTLMAEVAAIINAKPLIPVSTYPSNPVILTPATLLTQKVSVPSAPPDNSGRHLQITMAPSATKPSGADGGSIISHHCSQGGSGRPLSLTWSLGPLHPLKISILRGMKGSWE